MNARSSQPRGADDARAGCKRGEQRADEAMHVEERHHAEAAIALRQLERRADIASRRAEIGLRKRNDLRPRRRSRRLQDECGVVVMRGMADRRIADRRTLELEHAGFTLRPW